MRADDVSPRIETPRTAQARSLRDESYRRGASMAHPRERLDVLEQTAERINRLAEDCDEPERTAIRAVYLDMGREISHVLKDLDGGDPYAQMERQHGSG